MKVLRRGFVFGSVAALGSAVTSDGRAFGAEFQYKLGHSLPIEHPISVAVVEFAAAVARESNGRLEIQIFPNSVLGTSVSLLSQLRIGGLQMSVQGTNAVSSVAPITNVVLVAYAFRKREDALAALDGTVGALIRDGLLAKGIIAFQRSWANEFRQVTNSVRPIRSVEDWAGLKLRTEPSPIASDMFRTLGASPVATPIAEEYTSMQTHVIDGADAGSYSNVLGYKLYEVQKYITATKHQWSSVVTLINTDAWRALPADLQRIVQRNLDISVTPGPTASCGRAR